MHDDAKILKEKKRQAEYEAARKRAGKKASERKKQLAAGPTAAEEEEKRKEKDQHRQMLLAKLAEEQEAAAQYLTKLIVIGGHNEGIGDDARIKIVDVYDDTSKKWDTIRAPKCKRYMCGAITLDFPPEPDDDENDDGSSGSGSDDDDDLSDLRPPKKNVNKIVVIGGQKDTTRYGEGYDPETNKWVPLLARPPEMFHTKRMGCAVINWRGRAVVLGGRCQLECQHTTVAELQLNHILSRPLRQFQNPGFGRML
jgi:hypothetical protein